MILEKNTFSCIFLFKSFVNQKKNITFAAES